MNDDSVIDDGVEIDHVLPDGIYFDLDETIYHSLRRISASGCKDLDISNSNYWQRSWHNPDKVDNATPAMLVGKAAHTARLEPEKFTQQFVVDPDKSDYPQVLTTGTEIAAELDRRGEKKNVAGENVIDKAERLKASGYGGPIWHLIRRDFEDQRRNRKSISKAAFVEIMRDAQILRSNPEIAEIISGGASEVSILFTDPATDLQMKCRVDYLTATSFTDLKNFNNKNGKPLGQCVTDIFQYDRYHMQAAFYFNPLEMLRRGEIMLPIQGPVSDEEIQLIADILDSPKPLDCWFIFFQKGGVPNVLARQVHLMQPVAGSVEQSAGAEQAGLEMAYKHASPTRLMCRAEGDIRQALSAYMKCVEVFAEGEPWQSLDMVGSISDGDFAPWFLDVYGV